MAATRELLPATAIATLLARIDPRKVQVVEMRFFGGLSVEETAEVLTGIALVQLIRPGAPCVMGSFLSAIDMQSGSPSFGGPESVLGLYASGQIARRYGRRRTRRRLKRPAAAG